VGDSLEIVIDDTKACFCHFLYVDVMHVRRDANKAAHVLAKWRFLNC
jgi:hypothetical protein